MADLSFSLEFSPMSRRRLELMAKSWTPRVLQPIIRELGLYMRVSIWKNFEAQGRPLKWRAWSRDYAEQWRANMNNVSKKFDVRHLRDPDKKVRSLALGMLGKKLQLTGIHSSGRVYQNELKRDVLGSLRIKPFGFTLTSNMPYSKMMQYGGMTKGSIIGYVRPRPFLLFQEGDKRHIRARVNQFLLDHVRRLEGKTA